MIEFQADFRAVPKQFSDGLDVRTLLPVKNHRSATTEAVGRALQPEPVQGLLEDRVTAALRGAYEVEYPWRHSL